MSDLISRADAIEHLKNVKASYPHADISLPIDLAIKAIEILPSADAVSIHKDGTLEVKIPNAQKVGRVLVMDTDSHIGGGLFYPDDAVDVAHDIPEYCSWSQTYTNMVQSAMSKASADAVQGEWQTDKDKELMRCSVCGTFFNKHTEFFDFEVFAKYCPYCGARMKGGDDE